LCRRISGRLGHSIEQRGEPSAEPAAGVGELDSAAGPNEERSAEPLFEIADMPADSSVGDEELGGRHREAFEPGGGLERFQRIERGQAAGHRGHV
jgi:hypothetical protein